MKKYSFKHKKYIVRKSRLTLKKLTKLNRKKKRINHSNKTKLKRKAKVIYVDVRLPQKFNLKHENCEATLQIVSKIKRLGENRKNINILMNQVDEIGIGAISMLLSVLSEQSDFGIRIKGDKPNNIEAKDILEKSGFFKFFKSKIEDRNKETKNTILQTGDSTTPQTVLSPVIRKSMETVWGTSGRNPYIYGSVFEMIRNSCDHAFKNTNSTKWHLAISHDETNNRVIFSFVDNGKGILKTFSEGILKKVLHIFKDDIDIMETAFHNGIESRTGLSWRGKGLPTIYENYKDNYVREFIVISNDVYIDFSKNQKMSLKNPFSGTYYYWVIDQNCEKVCF